MPVPMPTMTLHNKRYLGLEHVCSVPVETNPMCDFDIEVLHHSLIM